MERCPSGVICQIKDCLKESEKKISKTASDHLTLQLVSMRKSFIKHDLLITKLKDIVG